MATLNSTLSLAGNSQSWSLDAIGNQTSVTTDGTTVDNTQNSQNELTGFGAATLTFDNNGNTTTDESGNTYIFNAWNQIVMVKNSSSTTIATYTYDADGRRTSQTESGATTVFYLSTQNQILEERQGSTVTAQNVWSIDYVNDLLLRDDNTTSGSLGISASGLGKRIYYQHDAVFNVTATTNTSGVVQQRFVYTPYGEQTALSGSWVVGGSSSVNGFQGGHVDPVTSLIYFGANGRDYSPITDTWDQRDLGYIDGANLYAAFDSDPGTKVDPGGHSPSRDDSSGPNQAQIERDAKAAEQAKLKKQFKRLEGFLDGILPIFVKRTLKDLDDDGQPHLPPSPGDFNKDRPEPPDFNHTDKPQSIYDRPQLGPKGPIKHSPRKPPSTAPTECGDATPLSGSVAQESLWDSTDFITSPRNIGADDGCADGNAASVPSGLLRL